MNEQNNPQTIDNSVESVKNSKSIWISIVVIVITCSISSFGIYSWVSSNADQTKEEAIEKTRNEMQGQIDSLEKQLVDHENNEEDTTNEMTNEGTKSEWLSYIDPEGVYSIEVPENWQIDGQWEKGNDLPDGRISYTKFIRNEGYMILGIAKLYSHTPEYQCDPVGSDIQILPSISIGGYKTYQSYSTMNVDTNYEETTAYHYCIDAKGKKLHFEFVPQASDNNPSGIMTLYDILGTVNFK